MQKTIRSKNSFVVELTAGEINHVYGGNVFSVATAIYVAGIGLTYAVAPGFLPTYVCGTIIYGLAGGASAFVISGGDTNKTLLAFTDKIIAASVYSALGLIAYRVFNRMKPNYTVVSTLQ